MSTVHEQTFHEDVHRLKKSLVVPVACPRPTESDKPRQVVCEQEQPLSEFLATLRPLLRHAPMRSQ
eukprot:scaffold133845_cov33-Tisochrysis_lutea.AAC.3